MKNSRRKNRGEDSPLNKSEPTPQKSTQVPSVLPPLQPIDLRILTYPTVVLIGTQHGQQQQQQTPKLLVWSLIWPFVSVHCDGKAYLRLCTTIFHFFFPTNMDGVDALAHTSLSYVVSGFPCYFD
jgi:hypothetical protein